MTRQDTLFMEVGREPLSAAAALRVYGTWLIVSCLATAMAWYCWLLSLFADSCLSFPAGVVASITAMNGVALWTIHRLENVARQLLHQFAVITLQTACVIVCTAFMTFFSDRPHLNGMIELACEKYCPAYVWEEYLERKESDLNRYLNAMPQMDAAPQERSHTI